MTKLSGLASLAALALAALALAAAPAWAQTEPKLASTGAAPTQVANSGLDGARLPPAAPAPAAFSTQPSALQGSGLMLNTDAMLGIHRRKQ